MNRWGLKLASLVIGAAAVLLIVLATTHYSDSVAGPGDLGEISPTPALIARGEYLARLGDCAACHSVPGRPPFSGGLRMQIPIGAIYSTNITPDHDKGIGAFTLSDFDKAVRFGVSRGHTLYPAMPYVSYAITRPDDVAALFAYFKYGVAAASIASPPNEILFPLSMRFPLTVWRWMFAPNPQPYSPRPGDSGAVARGGYFVQGLGHCGECHTPRGVALQLKAIRPADGSQFLSGAVVEKYFAPSLRSGGAGTLQDWSEADIAQFLTTGATEKGIAFASMGEVITHSTQYLTSQDAMDTASYLKSLVDVAASGQRYAYDDATHMALRNGDASARGAQLYIDNCAACHRTDGKGYSRVFPALAGNEVVRAPNPTGLISIVLHGSTTPRTASAPARFTMPGFSDRLTNREVAEIVTFIRNSWGNKASDISPAAVPPLRR